jgi:hypothetical protein
MGMNEDNAKVQGFYQLERLSLKERLTRGLGFSRGGYLSDPEAPAGWDGWWRQETHLRLGWGDRLRVLWRGKLIVRTVNRSEHMVSEIRSSSSSWTPW